MSPQANDENGTAGSFVSRLQREKLTLLRAQQLAAAASAHVVVEHRHEATAEVRFDPEVKLYLIESHTNYTETERADTWYADFDFSQRDMRGTVRAIRRADRDGGTVDESVVCARGLEHLRSAARMEQGKVNRDCCVTAVFEEQSRQARAVIDDKERLCLASRRGSEWSRNEARKMGLKDERDAASIRVEDEAKATRAILIAAARQYEALEMALDVSTVVSTGRDENFNANLQETSPLGGDNGIESVEKNFRRARELLRSSPSERSRSIKDAVLNDAAGTGRSSSFSGKSGMNSMPLRAPSLLGGGAPSSSSSAGPFAVASTTRSRSLSGGRSSKNSSLSLRRALSIGASMSSSSSSIVDDARGAPPKNHAKMAAGSAGAGTTNGGALFAMMGAGGGRQKGGFQL